MERQHNSGTNNLPPILFHSIHGKNVIISLDSTKVTEALPSGGRFSNGICFSDRPIPLSERVCIKFTDISQSWRRALSFGFTSNDPTNYRPNPQNYAWPNNWAKPLARKFVLKGNVLVFYVTELGDVHYGINGEERGIFFTGVSTNRPLWAMFDIYGNTVESVDPRQQVNNRRNNVEVEAIIPSLQTIENRDPLPQVYRDTEFQALPFHKTKGCNIRLSNDRCIAERNNSHYCLGYVFSQRPLRLGEKLVLQVLQTDHSHEGSLAFGLTTCDPSVINANDLPEDPHQLLDRSEYWVVIKDVANDSHTGDELAFKITEQGEVRMTKNRQPPQTLMHIDSTQKMWPFFDLNGSAIKVKVLGTQTEDNSTPENVCTSVQVMNTSVTQPISPSSTECKVCYEQPINSVLSKCGHVCMCYECAIKQWQGSGQCPICRAVIRDVIRTYWS